MNDKINNSNLILDYAFINALSSDKKDLYEKYFIARESGIKEYENGYHIGLVCDDNLTEYIEHSDNYRINKIALQSLCKLKPAVDIAIDKYGANRIALVVGITDACSKNVFNFRSGQYNKADSFMKSLDSCCQFLKRYLGIGGISFSISNACTSSANAIICADELLRSGVCDVAIVGGADIVTDPVFLGFCSLSAVDKNKTIPFSKNRLGINLGEASAFFVLARENYLDVDETFELKGYCANSDAFHMTSPNTDAIITSKCVQQSIEMAGLEINDIDYINLHGTGTELNDKMEAKTLALLNASNIYASSSKTVFGHTLGAAGAMELAVCCLALSSINKDKIIPPHVYDGVYDDSLEPVNIVDKKLSAHKLDNIATLSFAFGGSNTSLVVGK